MPKKHSTKQDTDKNIEDGESFLSRWSRKKSDTNSDSAISQAALDLEKTIELDEQSGLIQDHLEPLNDRDNGKAIQTAITDESAMPADSKHKQPLTDSDMPDINSLDESSDYSLFMSEGVSETLRKLALRKLFSGAGFNIKDGLDDYDDDFTSFKGLGGLITCDMKHQQEMKEKRELEEQQAHEAKARANAQDNHSPAHFDTTDAEAIDDPDREADDDDLSNQKPTDEKTDNASTSEHKPSEHNTAEVDSNNADVKN